MSKVSANHLPSRVHRLPALDGRNPAFFFNISFVCLIHVVCKCHDGPPSHLHLPIFLKIVGLFHHHLRDAVRIAYLDHLSRAASQSRFVRPRRTWNRCGTSTALSRHALAKSKYRFRPTIDYLIGCHYHKEMQLGYFRHRQRTLLVLLLVGLSPESLQNALEIEGPSSSCQATSIV